MSFSDVLLFGVVGLIALNHLLARLPRWTSWPWAFWPLQAINLATAIYLMTAGIPDLNRSLRIFNWILGLLFIVRIVLHNNRLLKDRRVRRRDDAEDAYDRKRDRIRAALHAAGEE